MKTFLRRFALWGIAMFELIPGAWRIGYWLGSRRANDEFVPIVNKWNNLAGIFLAALSSSEPSHKNLIPHVTGMVGGQGSGKTYLSGILVEQLKAVHLDVNRIRLHLEKKGLPLIDAHKIAAVIVAGLVSSGRSVVMDMSMDIAFTRGYTETFVRLALAPYKKSVTFGYVQNHVTWEQVIEGYIYEGVPEWYERATQKRFPGLTSVGLRISEAAGSRFRFYWPNGAMILRRFPDLHIVTDDILKGVRQLTKDEVNSVAGRPM